MNSVLSCPRQLLHFMNFLSPVTSIYTLMTIFPPSFFVLFLLSESERVNFPTHYNNHILVITCCDSSLSPSLSTTLCSPEHFPIFTKLSVDCTPVPAPTLYSFRCLHSIDIDCFVFDLQWSCLITNNPRSLGSLLISYNTTLSSLLDIHAPLSLNSQNV